MIAMLLRFPIQVKSALCVTSARLEFDRVDNADDD